MWTIDTPAICSECKEPLALDTFGGVCIVCDQVFCVRHMSTRHGVPNCAACDDIRRDREERGPIPQAQVDRVLELLGRDLTETIGRGQEAGLEESLARIRLFADADDFEQRVVDDIQQWLHDTFVDTSWPACPEHPHHPLWYSDGWWTCEQSGRRVAPLGGLGAEGRLS